MARKVPSDKFAAELTKLLNNYANGLDKDLAQLAKDFAKKGAKAINAEAAGKFRGNEYSKSWTSKFEGGRISSQGVIYSDIPGLPHLLEHGHANRGGGRTPGRPHIAPIEEKLIEEFQKAVEGTI